MPPALLAALATGLLLYAALHDIGFRTIPDLVPSALVADGGILRLLQHQLPASAACGAVVFILAAACWHRGWIGGGDVKLLGGVTFLVPPWQVPDLILGVAFAGGFLALLYLLLERLVPLRGLRRGASLPSRVLAVECRRIRRRASLPYATAIAAASVLMLVES